MAILSKGHTFADGDDVTSTKANNLVDQATFVSGASGTTDDSSLEVNGSGRLQVKASGITTGKLAASAVNTSKLANSTSTTDGVTFPKMRYIDNLKVIGNVSGGSTTPSEVSILDEDDMASDSATSLATQQSIKAFAEADITAPTGTTMATSGSVTLPGGLILKFGSFSTASDGSVYQAFPTAFPNNAWFVSVQTKTIGGGSIQASTASSLTTSGFTFNRGDQINGTSTHCFLAIGN